MFLKIFIIFRRKLLNSEIVNINILLTTKGSLNKTAMQMVSLPYYEGFDQFAIWPSDQSVSYKFSYHIISKQTKLFCIFLCNSLQNLKQ